MNNPDLVIIPPEVFQDHRLTLIETRVLCALFSFRNRTTNLCCPLRKTICERSGYADVTTISKAMRGLKDKGWISIERHRGPNTYDISVPHVADPATVTDPDTPHVTDPGTLHVADPCTSKQIIEQIRGTDKYIDHPGGRSFEIFWDLYPRKEAKQKAVKVWVKLPAKHKDAAIDDLKAGRYTDTDKRFVPHPPTYLNGHRWEDERVSKQGSKYS